MVSISLTAVFAVIVLFSALVGLIRGMSKTAIRLGTLVLAVILTFMIAGPVTTQLVENILIEGQTLGEMIIESLRSEEMVAGILDAAPLLQEAIMVAPALVVAIVVFPVVFSVLSFVSWIVFLFVKKPLQKLLFRESQEDEEDGQKKAMSAGERFAGLGLGVVIGALIFAMIVTPVLGLFAILPQKDAMDEAMDAMVQQNILAASDAAVIQNAYAVTDSPLVNFYSAIGASSLGRAYLTSVTKIEADGYKSSLVDEFDSLMATAQTAMKGGLVNALLSPEDPNAIYPVLADKDFMDALLQDMFSSKLLRSAVPEVMAMAMESVAKGMNVPANKAAVYNNMMDDVAVAVKDANINFEAIRAYEEAHGFAGGPVSAAAKLNNQAEVMTQEQYEEEIRKWEELTKTISSILNKAISGDNKVFTDSIASAIVNEVRMQAEEMGESALAGFDASSVQNVIANIDAESIDAGEGDATKLLEQLADQEKFETDVATVETVVAAIRESVKNAVADDEKAAETASTLASVVSDVAGAVSGATDENGSLDASKLDYDKIASAVTTLQNSDLKDVGSSFLGMAAAGDLGSNSMVSDALGAIKDGYEKGEDIGGTISSTGALVGLGSAMSGDGDKEAMVDSLVSLINNLNDYTISLLPSIFTTDTITSLGVPAEYADATYNVVETLLKELMKLKGAEDYDNEVNAILAIYNLATTGMEDFSKDDIPELADYANQSDAIFNTLLSVSTSNPFGIEIAEGETRQELVDAIEDGYAQSEKTQRDLDIYKAIATLLGLDADVNLG